MSEVWKSKMTYEWDRGELNENGIDDLRNLVRSLRGSHIRVTVLEGVSSCCDKWHRSINVYGVYDFAPTLQGYKAKFCPECGSKLVKG